MIHAVLQWQAKKPAPPLSATAAAPGETGAEAGPPGEAGAESAASSAEVGGAGEALPGEAGAKPRAPPSKARAETGAAASDQALPFCDDDAGEGPSSLIRETPAPKQDEDRQEGCDDERTGQLEQESGGETVTCRAHPKRPLLGLVLTPTRELAVQVKQHVDAVARFTGELQFYLINIS